MSLMGIDIGTTGCKASVYDLAGSELATAYEEYDLVRSAGPGTAELDSREVWKKVKAVIGKTAALTGKDPVTALCVTSMGEALVPVTADREILGNSITSMDRRGGEYVESALLTMSAREIHSCNGNMPGIAYSAPKLCWHRDHTPDLYRKADHFLFWADLALFLLGGEAMTNYSHANRSLLFDLDLRAWSPELADAFGLNLEKLAPLRPAAHPVGTVSPALAAELGLSPKTQLFTGGHDQCCGSLGCGAVTPDTAMFGLGTYLCLVPIYHRIENLDAMWDNGLNIEHHVDDQLFVSFIYHASGGGLVKWFRDVFAGRDTETAAASGRNIYAELFAEIPTRNTAIQVIPRFGPTGPPRHYNQSEGMIANLSLEHTRGDILKGMIEGMTFYFRDALETMEPMGIAPQILIATGGGTSSPVWLQMTADILEKTVLVTNVSQAGNLGAAMLAGIGSGIFRSFADAVRAMVKTSHRYDPNGKTADYYQNKFAAYQNFPGI